MQEQDKQKFSTLITEVMAFYRQDVSRFAMSVWWESCKVFDFEQVNRAINAHATDPERGQFAPKPADVIRVLQGTRTDRSRLAWSKLFDAMQRVGAYQSVAFDDPIIHAVVEDLGGWMKLCRSEMNDLSYTEHRFCESYRAYANRGGDIGEYPAKLAGQYELDNRQAGKRVAAPILIGDPSKAHQVLQNGAAGSRQQFTSLENVLPMPVARIGDAA